jgi:hypothetical protein
VSYAWRMSVSDQTTGSGLHRLLALTPAMGAATAYRAGASYAGVWYKKAPRLMSLWLDAVEPGPDAAAAGGELRAEVLAASKLSVKRVCHELNRGIHDLEQLSQPRAASKRPPKIT